MPSDSGYSIEDSMHEADERLPALDGDTPDPLLVMLPPRTLMETVDATLSPITPVPDPITPMPEVEGEEEEEDAPIPVHELIPVEGRPQVSPLLWKGDRKGRPYNTHSPQFFRCMLPIRHC